MSINKDHSGVGREGVVERSTQPVCQDVAIIGMSCMFPKSPNLQSFWENILNKADCISEVPLERWDWRLYFDENPKARDRIYSRWGGFIDPVVFNPAKYGIPPNALKAIDPVQLLALEVSARALGDAGYMEKAFDKGHTACIFGMAGGMGDFGLAYGFRASLPMYFEDVPEEVLKQLPEWTEDSFPGILPNVVSGRIANCFDLGAANFTVDSACASGLTATYLGVKEIISGNATMAIVGAADALQNPHGFLCFAKTSALTKTGRPKPFDADADGICISEGMGAVILKRRDLAERDGDRMYAVIRGVGSSSDGKGKSLTAPRKEGQARALAQAYDMAGFSLGSVGLIEAHGTGTVLGDGTEAESVSVGMREAGAAAKSCAIGSVKSNIGHTKGCAGIAGLIKTALALHHKVIPPTINVKKPGSASFRDPESPVYVNTEARPWVANGQPRRAGVNSFGFGGTNFHAVLEEAQSPATQQAWHAWPTELFVWRGTDAKDIAAQLGAKTAAIKASTGALRDIAQALWKGRAKGACTLAITADTKDDLLSKVETAQKSLADGVKSIKDPRGIYFHAEPVGAGSKVAYLFPGQGSQRPDMMRDLSLMFPELRDCIEKADHALEKRLPKRLSEYIYPPPRFSQEDEARAMTEITVTNIAQPSLGVTELGMFRILKKLGLKPDMVAGHSSGEYSALCAADVFSEETLYEILEDRGTSILTACTGDTGTMMAVKGGAKDIEPVLKEVSGVYVANFNSPSQTIISGLKQDLEKAAAALEAKGLKARFIPVSCAFHSPVIEPARDFLAKKLAVIDYHKPTVPVYANLIAAPYPEDRETMLHVLTDHLIGCVRFTEQIEAMYEAGARVFVEVGPGNVLSGLVTQILHGRPFATVSTDAKSPRHDIVHFQGALAQMLADGLDVQLDPLYEGRGINELDAAKLTPVKVPEKQSPVAWMVAPDRAWPVGQSRPLKQRVAMTKPSDAAPPPPPPPQPSDAATQVLARYQQLMAKFLEQQRDVMLAYLTGKGGAVSMPSPAMDASLLDLKLPDVPMGLPAAAPKPVVKAPAAKPAAAPAKPTSPAPAATGDRESTLLKLVSERTGYPNEMLGLDLSIESDLGIDSIKRLEILIAFSKTIPGAPDDLAEQLNTEKTLRGVLAKAAAVAGAPASIAPKAKAPAAAPGASAPAASGDREATLLKLVSERTGYPTDMLGLDLSIESDLGIDSIKRLEILIAFSKTIAGAPDDLAEQLNTEKTLRGVLAKAAAVAGAPASTVSKAPASVPAVAVPVASGDREATLLNLVSERTGYPTDMLGLDLSIESDLGIDSIKRLEILIAFAKTIAGAPDDLAEQLNTEKTLRGVLAKVSGASATVQSAPAVEAKLVHRNLISLKKSPMAAGALKCPEGVIIITNEGSGLTLALQERLHKAGGKAVIARPEELESAKAVDHFVSSLRHEFGRIGGVIHLIPMRSAQDTAALSANQWKQVVREEVKSLFYLLRAAAPDLKQSGWAVAFSSLGKQSHNGSLPVPLYPWRGGLMGMLKSVAAEWPETLCKVVDTDDTSPAVSLDRIVAELTVKDKWPEVYYRRGDRWSPSTSTKPVNASASALTIDPGDVVLILGGARGITAEVAKEIAKRSHPTLVLAARSPWPADESSATAGVESPSDLKKVVMGQIQQEGKRPTPVEVEAACRRILMDREMRANVELMKASGSTVEYVTVDVMDEDSMRSLIDGVYQKYGRIDGVINGAGVIEDKLIEDKTPESFDRVFDLKVQSVFLLSRLLKPENLKFLVFFSSIAGWFGNRGQADYAAANEVLNRMAMYLGSKWKARVVAIDWGPWDKMGMASDEVKRQFKERGVGLIDPEAGKRFMVDELLHGDRNHNIIVAEGAL